jgi:hypothetical protein
MISIERGSWVISATRRDIPVTPPSINELGRRNPFRPNPAEKTPSVIRVISLITSTVRDFATD